MSSLVSQPKSGNTKQTATAQVNPLIHTPVNRLASILTGILGIIATGACVIFLILALGWGSQPFPGFMVTPERVIDGSEPLSQATWTGLDAGMQRLDQIVAVNGVELADTPSPIDTYRKLISELEFGETVTFDFMRLENIDNVGCPPTADVLGDTCRLTLTMEPFGLVPFIGYFVAPFITAVICLLTGFFVLKMRPYNTQAQLVSAIAFSQTIFLAGLFDLNTTHSLIPLWLASAILLTATLLHLSMIFPVKSGRLQPNAWLVVIPYLMCGLFGAYLIYNSFNPPSPTYLQGIPAFLPVTAAMAILLVKALLTRNTAISAIIRDQSNIVIIGMGLSLIPAAIWIINVLGQAVSIDSIVPFSTSASTPFSLVAPLSLAYAVLQYKKFDTDRFISGGVTYGIMLIALISGYFLLVFSTTIIFTQEAATISNPLFIGLTIFVIAVGFLPVRSYLQNRIDRLYFRTRHDFQEYTDIFTHEISRENDLNRVVEELRDTLNATIAPTGVFMFMASHQNSDYVPVGTSESETDIVFSHDSGIVNALQADDLLIYLEPNRQWPMEIRSERPRLEILDALLIVGMHGSKHLNGFICIGPPRSGRGIYSYEEMLFIQNLLSQMAVAVERMQVVDSLERRVQELDALRQVSQAANFTITVDYLLELISTQTNRLLEARNFYIVLSDEKANEMYFAFFQEDGERYEEKEMRRWSLGNDLYSEIIRSEQPLRVPDFSAAMSQRYAEVQFENTNLKAWMGMPLVAGPRKIGVMAVATTQHMQLYGDDQLKTFSDIATLAATSIDKARLFEEAQKRARQLTALNDISQRLAGELEDVDKLLELITQNAVEILEAEAGSLLLMMAVDGSDKKELEFKIAVGPSSSSSLVGTRFPADVGLAGKVASKGRPVLVNDPASDPDWVGDAPDSSFHTSAILAVPLIANNQVLGVLEVLNKRDGGSYIQEDVELLTTFAGQAAVAIYNAQLFRMTDQQLSDRVQELETLERIDAELNRSLDASKVAEITIRWAIANSGATAGILGLVVGEPPMLQVISKYGYNDEDYPQGAQSMIWPLDHGVVGRVMRTRRADLVTDVSIDPNYTPSLHKSLSQITVPMLSAGEIIALLVLETNKLPRLNLVDLSFVQRLAEHASIALANAQLYAELTRSNDSKSEFVSFVAHELKQPMTSIKGYTDLLLMGAKMGKMQEDQTQFTHTIKSNIDRMITLVSDLNDVTQLQTNNLRMTLVPMDFQSVLNATLLPIQKQIEDRQQLLNVNVPEDLGKIYGDKNRLIQVLTNLVSNAHKYTPDAGTITLNAEIVTEPHTSNGKNGKRNTQEHPPMLLISVRDNGIGMTEEDRSKLFTPYFRSNNPLAKAQPGTGLGLTIVRGIIEQHGGEIWVESEIGEGTSFNFTVPMATEAQLAEAEIS